MKDILTTLFWISLGIWIACLFITIFYDNSIPMWISVVVMDAIYVWRNNCKN